MANKSQQTNQNVALFKEAVLLRDEGARLLGYPNHAAFCIEDKMAKEPATVNTFLSDLRKRLAPGGEKETKHLLELKKKDEESRGLKPDGNYYLWDHRFYDRMMVEQEYNIDEVKIAEYFPLQSTVRAMLHIFEELFGLVFVELDPSERKRLSPTSKAEDIAWHEDVILFSVWTIAPRVMALLAISISIYTHGKASMAMLPTSICNPVSGRRTERVDTLLPP